MHVTMNSKTSLIAPRKRFSQLSPEERLASRQALQSDRSPLGQAYRDTLQIQKGQKAHDQAMQELNAEIAQKTLERQAAEAKLGRQTWQLPPPQPRIPLQPLPSAEPGSLAANLQSLIPADHPRQPAPVAK
jgi:hypothetical protein